ncbi:alcohol dehydrogenase catalytic domain-containing protein [Kribbia dieselivorans]|uniref:alcohol dehydrogenase catalytic domain-containing protein n=1 Tax=Kribbia dieselivorans TaxID=331526 RepID=UPI000838E749|nr:alcohol dehydrogenase catalytic domain-containing protein [Kribbia dieselivorans]
MRAAVVFEAGSSFEVHDIERRDPSDQEVVVRIRAAGLCQSDISLSQGAFGQAFPVVLGHEGAGEIAEVGRAVAGWSVGDRVLVNWVPPCDRCYACVRGETYICRNRVRAGERSAGETLFLDGKPLGVGMGTATFAEETILTPQALVALPDDVPFEVAALMGCALPTGMGAALRTGEVAAGDTVVVVGCGTIGLSAIQGARVAGASVIVGLDPTPARREAALRLGATSAVAPDELSRGSLPEGVDAGGFDVGIDAVARAQTIRATWDLVRRGGRVVVVGAGRDEPVEFSAQELFHDQKTMRGSYFGSGDQRREVPRMSDLWRTGRIEIEGMIEARVGLDEIADVAARQARGEIVRAVVLP